MTGSISQKTQGKKTKQSKTNKNKPLSIKNAGSPQRADVSICEGINELYTWLQFCIEFFHKPARRSGDNITKDWSHEDATIWHPRGTW